MKEKILPSMVTPCPACGNDELEVSDGMFGEGTALIICKCGMVRIAMTQERIDENIKTDLLANAFRKEGKP